MNDLPVTSLPCPVASVLPDSSEAVLTLLETLFLNPEETNIQSQICLTLLSATTNHSKEC